MTGPPEMGDEIQRLWNAYDDLLRRCLQLEEIADRLAATAADPVAVTDYQNWKTGGS